MTATSRVPLLQSLTKTNPTTRVLLGHFPMDEGTQYLDSVSVDRRLIDRQRFDRDFNVARAHVAALSIRAEANVNVLLDHTHLKALEAEPTYIEHGGPGSAQLASVEVRKLAVFQPHVDWSYVEKLKKEAPKPGDELGLLRFCLPLQRDTPTINLPSQFSPGSQTLSVVIDNPDYRILGPAASNAESGRSLLGFFMGPGLHQMSISNFNGRYVLTNGYHRAVALAACGHELIPVLLKQANDPGQIPAGRQGMFSQPIVFGPNPPRIEDFLGHAGVSVPRRRTRQLLTIHAELHAIPD